jgi:hypothetical protein
MYRPKPSLRGTPLAVVLASGTSASIPARPLAPTDAEPLEPLERLANIAAQTQVKNAVLLPSTESESPLNAPKHPESRGRVPAAFVLANDYRVSDCRHIADHRWNPVCCELPAPLEIRLKGAAFR